MKKQNEVNEVLVEIRVLKGGKQFAGSTFRAIPAGLTKAKSLQKSLGDLLDQMEVFYP